MRSRVERTWAGSVQREWKVTVVNGERELVAACLAGDRDAFERLMERHQRAVYQLCYRFAGNHEDATDLAQDVFIRAFRGLGRFKGESSLATWLYRIGVNVCLNRRAAQPPRMDPIQPDAHVDHRTTDPADAVLRRERAERVRAAIARLPPKQRATVLLRIYHELPHDEIARILGSSVGTVKANLFHALANLRKLIGSEP
jgi:RNA polymerase sigma-70 factor (ECF subfamily)